MRRKSARAALFATILSEECNPDGSNIMAAYHLQYDAACGSLCCSSVALRSKKYVKGKTALQLPYPVGGAPGYLWW